MTAYDVATALMALVADNVAAINANAHIVSAGLSLTARDDGADDGTLEDSTDGKDNSPYRRLKVGDRLRLPPGLSICFCPRGKTDNESATGDMAERVYTVEIAAYAALVADPYAQTEALWGLSEALDETLFNATANYTVAVGTGAVYMCKVRNTQYANFRKAAMAAIVPGVLMTWTGRAYPTE